MNWRQTTCTILSFFTLNIFSQNFISPQEQQYANQFQQALHNSAQLNQDPETNYYLQNLLKHLLAGLQSQKNISVYLLDVDEKNAAAWPGGYITLYRGLNTLFHNEDELVSVLAHEVSHVIEGHINQLMNRSSLSAETILATLAGLAIGGSSLAAIVGSGVMSLQSRAFSRVKEKEADISALKIMKKANYPTRGMTSFLQRMLSQDQHKNAIPYFQTHPALNFRLTNALEFSRTLDSTPSTFSDIQSKFSKKLHLHNTKSKHTKTTTQHTTKYGFLMFKAKNQTQNPLDNNQQGTLYEQLIKKHANQYPISDHDFNTLKQYNTNNPYVLNLLALIALKKEPPKNALRLTAQALQIWNNFYPAMLTSAKIYHLQNNTQKAIQTIQQYLNRQQNNWLIQTELSNYYAQTNDQLGYWEAKSKEYALKGNHQKAIELLNSAKAIVNRKDGNQAQIRQLDDLLSQYQHAKSDQKLK